MEPRMKHGCGAEGRRTCSLQPLCPSVFHPRSIRAQANAKYSKDSTLPFCASLCVLRVSALKMPPPYLCTLTPSSTRPITSATVVPSILNSGCKTIR